MSPAVVAPEDLAPDLVPPEAVAGLGDVRRGIDMIDARIVGLLGLRLRYVLAAADFKPDIASIPLRDRFDSTRNSCSGSASISNSGSTALTSSIRAATSEPERASTSSTRSCRRSRSRAGGGSCVRP